jgi:predicted transcriptional regulator
MLRQTCVFLHDGHMKRLKKLADAQGLRSAHLIRVAIAEYLRRETRKK